MSVRRILALGLVLLTVYLMGREVGRYERDRQTLDAYSREAHKAMLLRDIERQATQGFSRLLASDPYLYDTIMTELPRWRQTTAVVRAVIE